MTLEPDRRSRQRRTSPCYRRQPMQDRNRSPLALVNALALTVATLLTGAWDAGGHGHDHEAAAANAARCTVDHEAEAQAVASHVTVGPAAPLHDHSCIPCQLGRATTNQVGKGLDAKPLDLPSATLRPERADGFESIAHQPRTARGPPAV